MFSRVISNLQIPQVYRDGFIASCINSLIRPENFYCSNKQKQITQVAFKALLGIVAAVAISYIITKIIVPVLVITGVALLGGCALMALLTAGSGG